MRNKKSFNLKETIKGIPTLTKIAAILFIVGKIHFIPAAAFALINRDTAIIFMAIYIACIALSIILTLIDIAKFRNKKDEVPPSIEQVRKWVKQYNLKMGVENE
tara:strand:+ start:7358 stop:7669 length:312 start_codon:yes stop_codon:yes gene_type:complete